MHLPWMLSAACIFMDLSITLNVTLAEGPPFFFSQTELSLGALMQPDSLCSWQILHVHREPKGGKHSFLGCFLQTVRQALQFLGQLVLVRVSAWGLGSEAVARMVPVWSPDDPSVGSFPNTKNHQLHHTLEERSSALSWSQKEGMICFS